MLYAAWGFWLAIIVFSAWGVHAVWSGLLKASLVNTLLLPGTLVAQLGHVLGLLVTGNTVKNTALVGPGKQGAPAAEPAESPRVPILGSIVIGLLPLAACATALYWAGALCGDPLLSRAEPLRLPQELPTSIGGAWLLLHDLLHRAEALLTIFWQTDLLDWRNALFAYMAVCLTVRMAPFEGQRRGALGAIVLATGLLAIGASLLPIVREFVEGTWPILSFAAALLVLLLLGSLLARGIVELIRLLGRNG